MTSPALVKSLPETLTLAVAYMEGSACTSLVAETSEGFVRINADGSFSKLTKAEAEAIAAQA